MITTGIDDLSIALPSLYLSIEDLANARKIEPEKLRYGLGLIEMAICDTDEDVVTLAAQAVLELVEKNDITPDQLGRIYVGTESSIDGSKPIASYILGLLSKFYSKNNISTEKLNQCDVVDMTFACIGAVDAMHNSLAWLHTPQAEGKVAIVVATDNAKYELDSSGEYTQGAGAVGVLLKRDPRLLAIDLNVGVGTQDEHDFFKPLRLRVQNTQGANDELSIEHKETPIFDGPFSNQTYSKRISEAWKHFKEQSQDEVLIDSFKKYIFHLPYAYHGRRVFADLFFATLIDQGEYNSFLKHESLIAPDKASMTAEEYKVASRAFLKARTKSERYSSLVNNKIEKTERLSSRVGNVYTASIFLALVSGLHFSKDESLTGEDLLFIAYGSGSKSKVFKGTLQSGWNKVVTSWDIENKLRKRRKINFEEYVSLRCHKSYQPLAGCKNIAQEASGVLPTNRYARYYNLSKNQTN